MLALWTGPISTWGIADFLILVVIVAACCAVTWIALKQFQVQIPPWAIQVFWVVVVAFVVIFAIRLLTSL